MSHPEIFDHMFAKGESEEDLRETVKFFGSSSDSFLGTRGLQE